MSAQILEMPITFEPETCCNCGMAFAMTADFRKKQRNLGKEGEFFCPQGHPQYYVTSENQKLKDEIEQLKRSKEWAEQGRDRAIGMEP